MGVPTFGMMFSSLLLVFAPLPRHVTGAAFAQPQTDALDMVQGAGAGFVENLGFRMAVDFNRVAGLETHQAGGGCEGEFSAESITGVNRCITNCPGNRIGIMGT